MDGDVIGWARLTLVAPELAEFGAARLRRSPAYLATVDDEGRPRVHPVTPIVAPEGLFVFMEPTSPKGRDLRRRGWYALHNGVPDDQGTGGEFFIGGRGREVDDDAVRAMVEAAASYQPASRYVLFELLVASARCNAYGDVALPDPPRWPLV